MKPSLHSDSSDSSGFIQKELSRNELRLEATFLLFGLKVQYFGHLMQRVDSLEKTLMLGGLGAGGERDDRG